MRLGNYLEEKVFFILFQISFILFMSAFLIVLSISRFYIILFIAVLILYTILMVIIDYFRIKRKSQSIINIVDGLEEKYLSSEVLPKPKGLQNKAYYYALKASSKAMNDKIGHLEYEKEEFEEYIESFVHDIKTPIAALSLSFENMGNDDLKEELAQIETKVEQMLFYARSDSVEKDYFIKSISLDELLHPVIMNYKNFILKNRISLNIHDLDYIVYTDEKWCTFILSQVMQNAIKYLNKEEKSIEILAYKENYNVTLTIIDNGCGINENDIIHVFKKGFTGSNRKKLNSTGMGLYLAKKLCDRLGLSINIESRENIYTKVMIVFPKNDTFNKKTCE